MSDFDTWWEDYCRENEVNPTDIPDEKETAQHGWSAGRIDQQRKLEALEQEAADFRKFAQVFCDSDAREDNKAVVFDALQIAAQALLNAYPPQGGAEDE